MKCPVCKEPNLMISERKGIEIDFCHECRGVWLDRGELHKILEKSKIEDEPVRRQEPYQTPHHPGHYQKPYKKKKSFFEELFD